MEEYYPHCSDPFASLILAGSVLWTEPWFGRGLGARKASTFALDGPTPSRPPAQAGALVLEANDPLTGGTGV